MTHDKAGIIATLHRLKRAAIFWILAFGLWMALGNLVEMTTLAIRSPIITVILSFASLWVVICFIGVALAYLENKPDQWKRADGTLTTQSRLCWPYRAITTFIWRLWHLLTREPAYNQITDTIYAGRRLLDGEPLPPVTMVIDLTVEFPEPQTLRTCGKYHSFPIFDASAPPPEELLAFARWLPAEETVYIHCAQGHGRTGLVILAVLLQRKIVTTIPEGIALMQRHRPGISLSSDQRHCIETMLRIAE
jgi:hypothetical protein